MGLNPDGSKPWLVRVSENKYFNNFADNLFFPIVKYGSYATGAGEVVGAIKGLRAASAAVEAGWMDRWC
jgi:hypothetical protein